LLLPFSRLLLIIIMASFPSPRTKKAAGHKKTAVEREK